MLRYLVVFALVGAAAIAVLIACSAVDPNPPDNHNIAQPDPSNEALQSTPEDAGADAEVRK